MASLPGRVGWSVTGDRTLDFARDPVGFIQRNVKAFNSRMFQGRSLNRPHAFVASNQGVKEILQEKADLFDMGYKDLGYMYSLFGDVVIFNSDDEALRLRNILHKVFKPEEVTRYMGQVEEVSSRLLKSINDKDVVIPYKLFKLITTSICLSLFLGLDVETAKEEAASITDLTITHWHGLISVPVNFNVYGYKSKYTKAMIAKNRLLDIVNRRLTEESNGFLKVVRDAGFQSKAEMANHVLLFVSALIPKALAALMTSFCIELGKPQNAESIFPPMFENLIHGSQNGVWRLTLEDEIPQNYENHKNEKKTEKRLRAARDDRYLENVLLEVKRLWPPFLGGRRFTRQDVVIDGYKIPAGHYVAILTRAANCDPKIFPEAETFLPERWDTCNQLDRDRVWTFGSGPRMCVGDKFIHKILKLLAKQLLQSYEWELVPSQDLTYKWLPVARPKNDIQVVFKKIGS